MNSAYKHTFSNSARTLWSNIRDLVRDEAAFLIGLLTVAFLTFGFAILADEVIEGDLSAFDNMVVIALHANGNLSDPLSPPWFVETVRDVTALGSNSVLGLFLLALIGYFILIRRRGTAVLMTVAMLGGWIVSTMLKIGFDRPRPDTFHAARVFTASFPSAHATLSAIFFLTTGTLLARMTVVWHLKIYFMVIAVLLTVLTGLSRVYLGVHYASDVLAGWSIGCAWAILCCAMALKLQKRAVEPTVEITRQRDKITTTLSS